MSALTCSRRSLLSFAAGAVSLPSLAQTASPIKLASLLDVSGNLSAYGQPMDMAATLAIEEINTTGGLLGRQIVKVGYDTQSDPALYPKFAQQLLVQDKVDVVIGGILSASREAIRPLLNRAKLPYFYTTQYEGGVCDGNTVLSGITPAQQAEVLVPYAMRQWGKKAYILAADYNYGQYMAKWFQKYLKNSGGSAVAVDFFALSVADFTSTISKIQTARPDFLLTALVGQAHLSFYRQWAAAGMKSKIPIASTTLGAGNEHKVLTPAQGDGILVAYNYSPELQTPASRAFLAAWAKRFGDASAVHELACAHYQGIMLWAAAVRQARSVNATDLLKALDSGVSIVGPSGEINLDPTTHHASMDVHVLEVRQQKLVVKKSFSQLPPRETQAVCDLKKTPASSVQYEIKF